MLSRMEDQIDAMIERGEVIRLAQFIQGDACACMGSQGDDPVCPCRMPAWYLFSRVDRAEFEHGRLVKLEGE